MMLSRFDILLTSWRWKWQFACHSLRTWVCMVSISKALNPTRNTNTRAGERVGCVVIVSDSSAIATRTQSTLEMIQRSEVSPCVMVSPRAHGMRCSRGLSCFGSLIIHPSIKVSNPPAFGSKIASTILGSQELKKAWYDDLQTMSGRIREMREKLFDELVNCGTLPLYM